MVKHDIQYFLGRDWKFLACICGIGCANQEYASIWCSSGTPVNHGQSGRLQLGTRTVNEQEALKALPA